MRYIFILFVGLFCLTSCTGKYENLLKSNTAEVREFVFEGQVNDIKANLICGLREKEYKINGYATELIEFGVLTFEMSNIGDYDTSLASFVIFVGDSKYDGVLEQNPFNNTLVADIKKIIDKNEKVVAKIIIGEYSQEVPLCLVNKNWKVDVDDVYSIVSDNFRDDINYLNKENVFEAEVYIKILNDAEEYNGEYYWYVSIVGRKGGSLSLIISPQTKDILAVNNTIKKVS